ncbi:MAG: hypothetical protein PVF83_12470 [Anaerolineales bacterium]|jgi:DMSO reductase anchor subunit
MKLRDITQTIRDGESALVGLISAFAPWLAPIAPAFMSYENAHTELGFPIGIAVVVGFVVEFLGLTTISTSLTFWNHNRNYKAEKNKVPTWIPILTFVFYLTIVGTLNLVLEAFPDSDTWKIVARALLVFLSVPAAVILAVRSVHLQIVNSLHRPSKKNANTAKQKKSRAAKALPFVCKVCGKEFAKVQGRNAHYKHFPEHNLEKQNGK